MLGSRRMERGMLDVQQGTVMSWGLSLPIVLHTGRFGLRTSVIPCSLTGLELEKHSAAGVAVSPHGPPHAQSW